MSFDILKELPQGFSTLLSRNPAALDNYLLMPQSERLQVAKQCSILRSEEEMRRYIEKMGANPPFRAP